MRNDFREIMNIHVFDNVLDTEDFKDYLNRLQYARFSDVMSQGIKYSDISQDMSSVKLYNFIDKQLKPYDGKKKLRDFKSKEVLSFVRAYKNKPDYRHPMWIHTDTLFSDYIGVYFVQPSEFPQDDGVSIWHNNELGTIELNTKDYTGEKNKIVDSQSLDPEKWTLFERIEFKKNRLVVFPASYFHSCSTYGHHGFDIDKCRIVHVLFFNKENNE